MKLSTPIRSTLALGLGLLGACTSLPNRPITPVLTAPAPSETNSTVKAPIGRVSLTVRWPERRYSTLAIPARTNSLKISVLDPADNPITSGLVVRPSGDALVTTLDLDAPTAMNQTIHVTAYVEEAPGPDSVPIAQGRTAGVDILPSTEVEVRVTLTPAFPPSITALSASNGGPNDMVTLTGSYFDGWGGPVVVMFGGVESPWVTGDSSNLIAQVPQGAKDGVITVVADGLTGSSSESFRVIRGLLISPQTATTSVGVGLDLTVIARDASESIIPDPRVVWSQHLTTIPIPGSDPPPASTMAANRFTPSSTGSFEIRVMAGIYTATASVLVE